MDKELFMMLCNFIENLISFTYFRGTICLPGFMWVRATYGNDYWMVGNLVFWQHLRYLLLD